MSNRNLRDREIYSRDLERDNQNIREHDSAATGLILGIFLAGLTALGIGTYFWTTQKPATQAPARTTIIERNNETTREVPVPQPQVPDVKPPDVNITIPNPAPQAPSSNAPVTAPAPAPQTEAAPQSEAAPQAEPAPQGTSNP